jgi:hypothetical protein
MPSSTLPEPLLDPDVGDGAVQDLRRTGAPPGLGYPGPLEPQVLGRNPLGQAGEDIPVLGPQALDLRLGQVGGAALVRGAADTDHVIDHVQVIPVVEDEVPDPELGIDPLPEFDVGFQGGGLGEVGVAVEFTGGGSGWNQ